jgi:putative DNA primase/helicase
MSAADVASALHGSRSGTGWVARCPCHSDDNPSLSIAEGSDGRVLLKCHAGCRQDELVEKVRDMGLDLGGRRPASADVATYDYRDRDGTVRYRVVRRKPKRFLQCQPDGRGDWTWNMDGVKPLPYRLPEMLAEPNKPIFIVEGEKDADRLAKQGLLATTNSGGAGKWRDELNAWFMDRDVVILADNDEAGREHAFDVARRLPDIARKIRIVKMPGLPHKGDVSDWLTAGKTVRDLRRLANAAPAWEPAAAELPAREEAASDDAEARPPEYSDDALALRFSTAHSDDARFVALWGRWLLWSGSCWQFDDTMRAFDLARMICRAASAEIDDKRVKLASAIASARTVAAIVSLSRADRRHAVTTDQFDPDPMIFNAKRTP